MINLNSVANKVGESLPLTKFSLPSASNAVTVISDAMKNDPNAAIGFIAGTSLLAFSIAELVVKGLDQFFNKCFNLSTGTGKLKNKVFKHLTVSALVAAAVTSANLLLSHVGQFAISKSLLAILATSAVALHLLFNLALSKKAEVPPPPPPPPAGPDETDPAIPPPPSGPDGPPLPPSDESVKPLNSTASAVLTPELIAIFKDQPQPPAFAPKLPVNATEELINSQTKEINTYLFEMNKYIVRVDEEVEKLKAIPTKIEGEKVKLDTTQEELKDFNNRIEFIKQHAAESIFYMPFKNAANEFFDCPLLSDERYAKANSDQVTKGEQPLPDHYKASAVLKSFEDAVKDCLSEIEKFTNIIDDLSKTAPSEGQLELLGKKITQIKLLRGKWQTAKSNRDLALNKLKNPTPGTPMKPSTEKPKDLSFDEDMIKKFPELQKIMELESNQNAKIKLKKAGQMWKHLYTPAEVTGV